MCATSRAHSFVEMTRATRAHHATQGKGEKPGDAGSRFNDTGLSCFATSFGVKKKDKNYALTLVRQGSKKQGGLLYHKKKSEIKVNIPTACSRVELEKRREKTTRMATRQPACGSLWQRQ